jgi:uncharacterized protein (TIGR03067 family)
MRLIELRQRWQGRTGRFSRRRPVLARPAGAWPVLERLEDRTLLTKFTSQAQIIFRNNQMTLLDVPGTYRIDAEKDPMQIDWIVQGGVNQGIFELRGDQLTLCFMQTPGGPSANAPPRPADFGPQPNKMVMTLDRLQP